MVRLAPVIARIPGVGVLGGEGDKGPRDDTADPAISLSPAANSDLARRGARHSSANTTHGQRTPSAG